jgi:LPS-assembly protein
MNRLKRVTITIAALVLGWLCPWLPPVQGSSYYRDDPAEPWHIAADTVIYDDRDNVYIGRGNVSITKTHRNLSADVVRFDQKRMQAEAAGNVVLIVGNDVFTGSRVQIDLNRETGTLYQGSIFLAQNHFHIKGEKIEKLGPATYAAQMATLTSCDGQRPDWKITGRKINVTVEGYGAITHGAFWVGPLPVLYSPLFFFPAKTKRQTGLLAPQIGYSERTWESYSQPFFWAINDSSDATFYVNHMERRGTRGGVEYRYLWSQDAYGTLMLDGFKDEKIDNGQAESSQLWGFIGDTAPRPNQDRWWLRMKHDQVLAKAFNLRLDLDLVSDQDYLHEFRSGYMGFDYTDAYFSKTFGRDLDTDDETARLNRLLVSRLWPAWSLNAESRWYDDVINRRQNDINAQVQQLPVVQLASARQQVARTPFYYDLESLYSYTYKEQMRRRHMADVHPRAYLPVRYKNILALEPSVGVRETAWYMDHDDTTAAATDDALSRELYDARLDLSSQISRVFSLGSRRYDRLKHAIRPQITHEYIPGIDESRYPDTVGERNRVTYWLTQFFTLRSRSNQEGQGQTGEDRAWDHRYRQLARLQVGQSYDINEAREDNPFNRADPSRRMPFSPVIADVIFAPSRYVAIEADAARSPYHSYYDFHNVGAIFADRRGDQLTVEHRYRHDFSETFFTELQVVLTDRLSTFADYERNLHDDRDISYGAGFFYQSQCWSFQFEYVEEDDDRRYALMVHLEGLGQLGRKATARKLENPLETE